MFQSGHVECECSGCPKDEKEKFARVDEEYGQDLEKYILQVFFSKMKTKEAIWNALRTALKPEKNLRTAKDEIYKLVTSNGEFRDRNVVKLRIGV